MDRPAVYVRSNWPSNDPTYAEVMALAAAKTELKSWWDGNSLRSPLPITCSEEPVSADWKRWVRILHTPKGDLRSAGLISLKGLPGMTKEYFLKDRADAEKYLSLPMPTVGGDLSSYLAEQRKMGDAGIVEVAFWENPAGWTAELFGSEAFAMMTVTDRDVIHELCRRHLEIHLATLKYAISNGAGPYFATMGHEMIVPPLHGPADFRDFVVRYDQPTFDLIHEAGGAVHVHCHGKIAKVFADFVAMGCDVIHPVEPPPMGDLTAAEAKAIADGKLCIEGNVQVADMYEKSPQEIRRQVTDLINQAFDDHKGLIVSPSASLYQYGKGQECFEQFKAMVETVVNWGKAT
jgi:hypothetical protein